MDTVDFASDEPNGELLPLEELADCASTVLAQDGKTILSYGSGAGYTPLRELIGEWFGVHPFRVVLTSGWQQALNLVGAELAVSRTTAIEYPANPREMDLLLGIGGSLVYVLADDEGFFPDDLETQLTMGASANLVLVNPDFANPTGRVMPLERRIRLMQVVRRFNARRQQKILVLENGSYELTRYEGTRVPGLFEVSERQTLFGSSFSATIAPGVRTGFLILPDELARSVAQRANDTYITPPLLGQATAFEFVRRGSLEPHLGRLREMLRGRRDAMLDALAKHFPDAKWTRPEGGYFVWLELPAGLDGRELLSRAKGVTARQGLDFVVTSNFIRLSYAATGAAEIPLGIERLAAAMP